MDKTTNVICATCGEKYTLVNCVVAPHINIGNTGRGYICSKHNNLKQLLNVKK